MSRLPHPHSAHGRVEHLQDFTSLDWCQDLLSDPSITRISKRQTPDQRSDVSNTLFTKTLFTDDALRAYLSMYRPGKAEREHDDKAVFTGNASAGTATIQQFLISKQNPASQSKEEQVWSAADPDTPEMFLLISLGRDVDGGVQRLHGGVTATLLDQVMGTLISYVYDNTCATADLNVKYKAAVTTPCVLLCRAKVVRKKGRWIESVGWVEDGQGKVFAEGKGAFVMNKNTLMAAAKI
ncbi:hypothetical protein EJ07DRAFT_135786 [Lizonia empirigonia]|nr:hypothetical protein EJ07DRAFT_135786 [Lizonia empirigonia]